MLLNSYVFYVNVEDLIKTFKEGVDIARKEHVPVFFHVEEITQPQGHSTSGSHERYKSEERLKWEQDFDGIKKMRDWILKEKIASKSELDKIEEEATNEAKIAKKEAWKKFKSPVKEERDKLVELIDNRSCKCKREGYDKVGTFTNDLKKIVDPIRKDNFSTAKKILHHVCTDCNIREKLQKDLTQWLDRNYEDNYERYNTALYNESKF